MELDDAFLAQHNVRLVALAAFTKGAGDAPTCDVVCAQELQNFGVVA